MIVELGRVWKRWRHVMFDHIHFMPFDDPDGQLIGHVTPPDPERHDRVVQAAMERERDRQALHALRGGRVAADPNHNHPSRPTLVQLRGGLSDDPED